MVKKPISYLPRNHGRGKRLATERSWVRILALNTRWNVNKAITLKKIKGEDGSRIETRLKKYICNLAYLKYDQGPML